MTREVSDQFQEQLQQAGRHGSSSGAPLTWSWGSARPIELSDHERDRDGRSWEKKPGPGYGQPLDACWVSRPLRYRVYTFWLACRSTLRDLHMRVEARHAHLDDGTSEDDD